MRAIHSTRRALPILVTSLLIGAIAQPGIAATASGTLITLDFKFGLSADESVEPGPPVIFTEGVGTGDNGKTESQPNYGPGEDRGPYDPSDPLKQYELHLGNGPVSATAPSPDFAEYITSITAFATFRNYSLNPADIEVHWNATDDLAAHGDKSHTEIDVQTRRTPDGGDPTNTQLFMDSLDNDAARGMQFMGNLPISVAAATMLPGNVIVPSSTELRIEATVLSRAVVPEPLVLPSIIGAVALLRPRSRHRCN